MIKEFQGEFRWLSNFAPCKISLGDLTFPSVEHAYMSCKCEYPQWKQFCVSEPSPGKVKKASKTIKLVSNWELIKVPVMILCVTKKFNQEPYKTKLINTGGEFIQEGNRWGDKFWGVDLHSNQGCNTLGTIIMSIRSSIIFNELQLL